MIRFFKKKKGDTPSPPVSDNPYIASRQLWEDIYGNAETRYRSSRRLNFMLAGVVVLAVIGLIAIGQQSKFIPYVVQVQDGQIIYGHEALQSNTTAYRSQLALYFMRTFLTSARSVTLDGVNQQAQEQQAFALTSGAATGVLQDFFDQHDPFKIAAHTTIALKIKYVNALSGQSYQCGWEEEVRNSNTGELIRRNDFVGTFTVKWGEPSQNEAVLSRNPFGFFVTSIAWTPVHNS